MSAENSFEQLKAQDDEVRRLVNAADQETTPEAVARAINTLISAHFILSQTWTETARKIAKDYSFVWPDCGTEPSPPFEVPLGIAWNQDKTEIIDLQAKVDEFEKDQADSDAAGAGAAVSSAGGSSTAVSSTQ